MKYGTHTFASRLCYAVCLALCCFPLAVSAYWPTQPPAGTFVFTNLHDATFYTNETVSNFPGLSAYSKTRTAPYDLSTHYPQPTPYPRVLADHPSAVNVFTFIRGAVLPEQFNPTNGWPFLVATTPAGWVTTEYDGNNTVSGIMLTKTNDDGGTLATNIQLQYFAVSGSLFGVKWFAPWLMDFQTNTLLATAANGVVLTYYFYNDVHDAADKVWGAIGPIGENFVYPHIVSCQTSNGLTVDLSATFRMEYDIISIDGAANYSGSSGQYNFQATYFATCPEVSLETWDYATSAGSAPDFWDGGRNELGDSTFTNSGSIFYLIGVNGPYSVNNWGAIGSPDGP